MPLEKPRNPRNATRRRGREGSKTSMLKHLLFPNCAVPLVVPCLLCGHHSKGRRDEAEQSCLVPIYSIHNVGQGALLKAAERNLLEER